MVRTNRATIEVIKHERGLVLFYFLGCFSVGPKLETLREIWHEESNLTQSLHLFQKLGIMEPSSHNCPEAHQRKCLNLSLRQVV